MQSSSNPVPDSDYIPRDDVSEAKRLEAVMGTEGLGDVILDNEDVKLYGLQEFGMDVDFKAQL